MTSDLQLWQSENGERWFLVPRDAEPSEGDFLIRSISGESARVSEGWAAWHEVGEERGRAWAKAELGLTLDELKHNIDEVLTDRRRQLDAAKHAPVSETTLITPDAVPGLLVLLKELPGIIGDSLSGDAARLGAASGTMAGLRQRLSEAGIDVDERFSNFPDRLAGLREDFANRSTAKGSPAQDIPVDDR
jgi:hypothetical protein